MVCTTRFNPTTTGALHLGHVFTALVNEQFASVRGGRFLVRWDDNWQIKASARANRVRIKEEMRYDLQWLGLQVDDWFSQTEMLPSARKHLQRVNFPSYPIIDPVTVPVFTAHLQDGWLAFPYQPSNTAERVYFDNYMGVTDIIRGEELAPDTNLHCYLCDLWHMPIPRFYYVPRLQASRGDISKTAGGYTVAELRADGWGPSDIIELLKWACLRDPVQGFDLHNLKPNPKVAL